jgi:membrane protease YdiL (CAAX protease family)
MLTMAVVPAITEELLMRGMIMQPLRRFGNGFALVCSSILFALLHQNMTQAPMAFFAGLALGWASIKTGALWAPILIHFWNNAVSVGLLAATNAFGAAHSNRVFLLYALTLAFLGLACLLSLKSTNQQPAPNAPPMRYGRLALHYFFGSPAMAFSVIYFVAMLALGVYAMA